MVGWFSGGRVAVVAENAGLRHLAVIHANDFLPVKCVVATVTSVCAGNMILWFEGGIQQAIGYVAQLAFPRCAGKHSPLVAAVALQVLVSAAQFEAGCKMVEFGLFGLGHAACGQPE